MSENLKNEGLHSGHRDRMRNRFRNDGADSFCPHELLEMLLYYSVPRKDTNPIAHELINTFGSLSAVLEASKEQLLKVKGVSENTATLIKLILPIYHEYRRQVADSQKVKNADDCGSALLDYYMGVDKERIVLISLTAGGRVLGLDAVCDGDLSAVPVNYRKFVEIVMKYPLATSVIVAHNHPGGLAVPSRDDIATTEELRRNLNGLGICLVDHIIVADGEYVSMASTSMFKEFF